MAPKRPWRPAAIEKAVGHKFKDKDLLRRALTHASASAGAPQANNERLEFLGDRVLGLVVAETLWRADPLAREGELARRYNRLVRRETCAQVGRSIEIGCHIILSESEAANGGHDKDTILADAVEAILGAVYLDAGYEAARQVVKAFWAGEFDGGVSSAADAKSALQEWAQGRGLALPRYREVARSGPDHAPVFMAEVIIDGLESATGEGPSKRQAEQVAAQTFLKREGIGRRPDRD